MSGPKPDGTKQQVQASRAARLAEELRANLARRKQQARSRKSEAQAEAEEVSTTERDDPQE